MNDIWGPPSLLPLLSSPPPSCCLLLPLLSSSLTLPSYAPSLSSLSLQLCAPPLSSPPSLSDCQGVCNDYFGMTLHFAGESMLHTGHQLPQWVKEPNSGSKSFSGSILAKTGNICLPYNKIILDRSCNPEEGFIFWAETCSRNCPAGGAIQYCSTCHSKLSNVSKTIRKFTLITSIIMALHNTLPMFGLEIGMATLDAAGCNWISYWDTLCWQIHFTMHYLCLMKEPVTKQWFIFIAEPHLTKNIDTCLELSSSKKSNQNPKHGNMSINMGMMEEI